ncbi:MAG: AMP-binding protein [Spirochaetaceae bacterium]
MSDEQSIRTFPELLGFVTESYGDHPGLGSLDGSMMTYREVGERAQAASVWLRSKGVGKGDRVALVSENRPEWPIWYLGIVGMGAVVVPVLTDFHPRQVENILYHSQPTLVVSGDSTEALVEHSPVPVYPISSLRELPAASPGATEGSLREIGPDDLATIIYTSGTTGNPKGVMLSHFNLISNAQGAFALFPINTEDNLLSILPLAHSYEWTIGFLTPILGGASITYLGGPPTISKLLSAFATVRPTIVLSVPLILEKIHRARVLPVFAKLPRPLGGFPPVRKLIHRIAVKKILKQFGGRIRFFGVGGAAISPATERFLREGRFPYAVGYGLTETAPLLAGTDVQGTRYRSTGPALRNVELRLEEGEIQARGPNIMLGYYRNPEATAEVFTDDGWFKTGDLGAFDKNGYLYIKGRAKSVIVGPSGENIYPEEIEAEIDAEPLVEESLVLSKGDRLVALVRLNIEALAEQIGIAASKVDVEAVRSAAEEALGRLQRSVNARLNHFSRLAEIILQTEELERTPTKKIKRFLYQQDHTSGGSPAAG